jgi:putative membrane protein
MMGGSGGMFFGGGFMWIFWLLVIVVIVAAVKAMMAGNAPRGGRWKDSALSILEKRYARGEIDQEEYQEKRRELED